MTFTKEDIIATLKTIFDPEIPVNIWDMGLIYDIDIKPDLVVIKMTFTSPTCPMMEELLEQVRVMCQCVWIWCGTHHGICHVCRMRRVWNWI